jgi:hypothetical protein
VGISGDRILVLAQSLPGAAARAEFPGIFHFVNMDIHDIVNVVLVRADGSVELMNVEAFADQLLRFDRGYTPLATVPGISQALLNRLKEISSSDQGVGIASRNETISTVGELASFGRKRLLGLHFVGKKLVAEADAICRRYGCRLAP